MPIQKIDSLGPARKPVLKTKPAQFLLRLALCGICWGSAAVAAGQTPRHIRVTHVTDIRQNFNQPTEVAVGRGGNIFVLDGANHQVKIFTPDLTLVRAFGRAGQGIGEFRLPVGMDIDPQGQVYIADTGNRRIQIFNGAGKFLRQIDLSPWKARAVEVQVAGGDRRIYVADAENHRILCFDQAGSFNFAWGDLGQQLGELRFPGMMAATQKGDLHVVDILNGRVQVFDVRGKNPRQISELGVLPGQLYRPKGIVVDERAHVFVSDSYTGIIQVFGQTGKPVGILSAKTGALLRLTTPLGMALDARGRLFVVQSRLNLVSVFMLDDRVK